VEANPAACAAPAVRLASFNPAVARTAGRFDIRFHHHAQRLNPRRKAELLKALLNVDERFLHSPADRRGRQCDISLHGVALFLDSTPRAYRIKAGNAAPLQSFNIDRDISRLRRSPSIFDNGGQITVQSIRDDSTGELKRAADKRTAPTLVASRPIQRGSS